MTTYRGPNAFRNGTFKPARAPTIIAPYVRSPSGEVRKADGPAFNNKFPKSRYRGGGQSGLRPVLEVVGGGGGDLPELLSVIDFAGDTYTVGATPYTLTDAIESDDDWGEVFDPAEISAAGWVALTSTSGGKLKGPFKTVALADHICVLDVEYGTQSDIGTARYDAPDFTTVWYQIAGRSDCRLDDDPRGVDDGDVSLVTFPLLSQGSHTLAVLRSASKFAISIDGGDTVRIAGSPIDNSAANTFTLIIDGHAVHPNTVRSLKFYSPGDGSDATLEALSTP